MQELRAIADEIGALLIIDEIQAGMGRTGKWFCHEHYGVKADIVTVAKGIASGYPLGAIAARARSCWDKCLPGSMGGTYGGNAVACAAGVATIDAMEEDGMLANAARQGEKLRAFCDDSRSMYPAIGEVARQGPHVRHRVRRSRAPRSPTRPPPRRSSPSAASRRSSSWAPAPSATACASSRRSTSPTPTWTSPSASSTEAAKVAFA